MEDNSTGAHLLVDLLVGAGVSRVFGVPGGPLLSLLKIIDSHPSLEFVLAKDEEGAVFMAEGYAQVTGRLGVACVSAGPGTTHAITGAASATGDGVPIMVLAGQVATTAFSRGALQDSSGGNWGLDTVAMLRSATKLSALISDPSQLETLFHRAVLTATTGLPGAVHLALPANVLTAPAPRCVRQQSAIRPARSPAPEDVESLAQALTGATRPVILAGQGAKTSRTNAELVELAERRGIPVVTTLKGKSVFPEDHPLAGGVIGNYGGTRASHALAFDSDVDLLLVLGSSLGEVSTFGWDQRLVEGRTVYQVDIDPLQHGRSLRVDHAITADVRRTLLDLLQVLGPEPGHPRAGLPRAAAASAECLQKDHAILRASAVAARLGERLPDNSMLFMDNGNALCWLGEHVRSRPSAEIYCSLNVGCMGYAIPASIGAALANRSGPVVGVVGDAAFAMSAMEMHTAVELELSIVWVVLNNRGNAMVANLQELLFDAVSGSMYRFPIDAAAVARGVGVSSTRVSTLQEFDAALIQALTSGGPWLIDALVDPDEIAWSLAGRAATIRGAIT